MKLKLDMTTGKQQFYPDAIFYNLLQNLRGGSQFILQ